MQNVPKIVSERLRVAQSAVNHPDADMLTAFSERSLPDLERAIVVEHLARCGECREIVALALPAEEEVQIVTRPARSGWLAWPALRWGFVAAGVVVIASFGLLQFQRHKSLAVMYDVRQEAAATEAKSQPPAPAPPPPATTESVKVEPAQSSPEKRANEAVTAKLLSPKPPAIGLPSLHLRQRGAGSGTGSGRGYLSHGPSISSQISNQMANQSNQWQANSNLPQTRVNAQAEQSYAAQGAAAAPSPSRTVSDDAHSFQINTEGKNIQPLVNQRLDQAPPEGGSAEAVVGQANPGSVMIKSPPKYLVPHAPSQVGGVVGGLIAGSNPKWTINSTGGLQRSFDQGTTWQDVNVNAPPGMVEVAANFDMPKTSRAKAMEDAKQKDSQRDKKTDELAKQKTAAVVFRAVAANGSEVWAGGSSGFLYHSVDAGASWIRVIPTSPTAVLTGDIVSVEFADAQKGKVATSTAEVWVTSDAGQTWQKQ